MFDKRYITFVFQRPAICSVLWLWPLMGAFFIYLSNQKQPMTVKELKELLADAPDDLQVLIPAGETFDGFFRTPCMDESGVSQIPEAEQDPNEPDDVDEFTPMKDVFMLCPHAFSEEQTGPPVELN